MQLDIRRLFIKFDSEMRAKFGVHNKYHRFSKTAGWMYGYGRNYNCELLAATIQADGFHVPGVFVKDEETLQNALAIAKQKYDDGFEAYCEVVSAKKRASQIARAKVRVAQEKEEMAALADAVPPGKLNQFRWCKKVPRNDLLRLYRDEAAGLPDEALLDEVGFAFYARCKQAHDARDCTEKGQIICHHCGAVLYAGKFSPTGSVLVKPNGGSEPVKCDCGYAYTYREYRRSYMAVNMPGNRATPVFERFEAKWPTCRDATAKMLLIDWLIHECHVTLMSGEMGKSVCENLIEGTRKQITELIDRLAYGNV